MKCNFCPKKAFYHAYGLQDSKGKNVVYCDDCKDIVLSNDFVEKQWPKTTDDMETFKLKYNYTEEIGFDGAGMPCRRLVKRKTNE